MLVKIYMKQGRGCSLGNESAQPEALMSDYSLLYSTVYCTVYSTVLVNSVECSVKYSIGMWGFHQLIGW